MDQGEKPTGELAALRYKDRRFRPELNKDILDYFFRGVRVMDNFHSETKTVPHMPVVKGFQGGGAALCDEGHEVFVRLLSECNNCCEADVGCRCDCVF